MPGISPTLLDRLLTTLARCGPFASDGDLRAAFTDARIAPWAEALPHADSPAARVQRTVAFLGDKHDAEGTNALVLLLRVLADRAAPADACHRELAELAAALAQEPPEALATLSEMTPSQVQVALDNSQAGVVGDGAHVEGGVHQDSHAVEQHAQADHGGMAVNVGGDADGAQVAGRDIVNTLTSPWVIGLMIVGLVLVGVIALPNLPIVHTQLQNAGILPTDTPTPTATPTPLPITPEAEGEVLIVVAQFHYSENLPNTEAHHKIRRAIEQAADDLGFINLRVNVEPTRLAADNREEANALGALYDASLVIWGEDTGVEVRVNFYNRKQPDVHAADVQIEETARTQIVAPSEYAEFVTQDLPQQLTFLALFAVGQSYYTEEAYTESARVIEKAVAALERQEDVIEGAAEAYFRLGWLYQDPLDNVEKAQANYDRALELDPELAMAYNNRGTTYDEMGAYEQAVADYDRALELDPAYAAAYNNRGLTYHDMGEYEQALADYDRAIELDPEDATAYYNRENTYKAMGAYEQALADYDRALELDPEDATAYYNRGNTYYNMGAYEQALADYDRALELDPELAVAYNSRGLTYYNMGAYEQAVADYDRALALDPEDADVYNNRGITYKAMGEYEQAVADYDRALALDPAYAEAYNNRGNIYYAMDEYEQAVADYDRAAELMTHPGIYYNGARAHAQFGDVEEACTWLEEAIALDDQVREWARTNAAFDPIRDAACFRALVGEE